jgi:hypothetical protein
LESATNGRKILKETQGIEQVGLAGSIWTNKKYAPLQLDFGLLEIAPVVEANLRDPQRLLGIHRRILFERSSRTHQSSRSDGESH